MHTNFSMKKPKLNESPTSGGSFEKKLNTFLCAFNNMSPCLTPCLYPIACHEQKKEKKSEPKKK